MHFKGVDRSQQGTLENQLNWLSLSKYEAEATTSDKVNRVVNNLTFGAGFEAGMKFLEREVKATHIIMRGLSLGGGMMGEAILNHDFTAGMKKDIRYLFIADRSFSRLSTVAVALVGLVVQPIFYITGTEPDGVAAACKLSQLGIQQIIIQHTSERGNGSDYVIPDNASLAYELHKNPSRIMVPFRGT